MALHSTLPFLTYHATVSLTFPPNLTTLSIRPYLQGGVGCWVGLRTYTNVGRDPTMRRMEKQALGSHTPDDRWQSAGLGPSILIFYTM